MTISRAEQIAQLENEWKKARWEGITRPYSAEEVVKLRGSVNPEHTLATRGAQGYGINSMAILKKVM